MNPQDFNKQNEFYDKIFKILLLIACALSVFGFGYGIISPENGLDKLGICAGSSAGGGGSFYAFMKWRIIEGILLNQGNDSEATTIAKLKSASQLMPKTN